MNETNGNITLDNKQETVIRSKCPNCGSELKFQPDNQSLCCVSCGSEFPIESIGKGKLDSEENDYAATLQLLKKNIVVEKQRVIHCEDCGGLIVLNQRTISTICPFCGSNRTVQEDQTDDVIKIDGVIPFTITEEEIQKRFKEWIHKKIMAPKKLKKGKLSPSFSAFYIPFWTYDADTKSRYSANRGDYYYTTRVVRTKNGTHTVRERHTRWTHVNGVVDHFFDDVLIRGTSNTLNNEIDKIKNFDFTKMEKYQEQFLLGYYAEKPSITLEQGFTNARQIMMEQIKLLARRQIGGDVIENLNVSTNFSAVTFKQIMAPIYNGHYVYNKKKYRFVANAQTGKFSGSAPISPIKVTLIVFAALIVIVLLALLATGMI